MGVTRHTKVLSDLEKRALVYRRKGQKEVDQDEALFNEALNETLTVSTLSLTDSDDESLGTIFTTAEATYLENEDFQGVSYNLLSMHGIVPGPKGVTRLI